MKPHNIIVQMVDQCDAFGVCNGKPYRAQYCNFYPRYQRECGHVRWIISRSEFTHGERIAIGRAIRRMQAEMVA